MACHVLTDNLRSCEGVHHTVQALTSSSCRVFLFQTVGFRVLSCAISDSPDVLFPTFNSRNSNSAIQSVIVENKLPHTHTNLST
jgi:hypothetical protein